MAVDSKFQAGVLSRDLMMPVVIRRRRRRRTSEDGGTGRWVRYCSEQHPIVLRLIE